MIKTITGCLPWTDKTSWQMPESDKHRMDRCFRDGPGDLDTALPMLLPHLKGRRTCVQAGGCIGVWPLRLAQFFECVVTFEPEPVNFQCLRENTRHLPNVIAVQAALSHGIDSVTMRDGDPGNCGGYFVEPGGEIPAVQIDDCNLHDVDLIYLDVEGHELAALQGAAETIARDRPIIGMEDKHAERSGSDDPVRAACETFGYRVLGRPFPLDVILVPDA